MLVAPSILSADFGNLEDEIKDICKNGADLIHIDIMDGHFVPNLTIGPMVVEAISKISNKPLDIHLMVENNSFFIDIFSSFKPKYISFHIEEEKHPHRIVQKIRKLGIKPAVALNPATTPKIIEYLIKDIDMVLLMSVNPGFGGQKFIPIYEKIYELKKMIKTKNPKCLIEVDGGISNNNIEKLKTAGVDIAVAGSYIFGQKNRKKAIESLKI
jgi:ribulose-phosphate 3-epimerase